MLFFRHAKYSILEFKHVAIGAAVPFGEYGDGVTFGKAVVDQLAHACILAWILMIYRNASDSVQNPAENGNMPKFALGDKGCAGNGGPDHIDVQETLVVGDNDEIVGGGDVFFSYYVHLDSENFE